MTAGFGDGRADTRSPLRAVRNLFLTGLDPASLAGMAAAVAVAGEYPPPGAGGGPPEFLTGPPGQGPPAPTGGSPGEFLAPSGKREISPPSHYHRKSAESRSPIYLGSARERTLYLRSRRFISVIFAIRAATINSRAFEGDRLVFLASENNIPHEPFLYTSRVSFFIGIKREYLNMSILLLFSERKI